MRIQTNPNLIINLELGAFPTHVGHMTMGMGPWRAVGHGGRRYCTSISSC